MKHSYKISGMTCTGCKTNVESALGNLKEITKVVANLKEQTVDIEMTSHVPLEKLQETLLKAGLHYTIQITGYKFNTFRYLKSRSENLTNQ